MRIGNGCRNRQSVMCLLGLTEAIAILWLGMLTFSPGPVVAEEPYKIHYADPLKEPWRISRYPELKGRGLRCLTEDQAGNFWFGVKDGVVRYDGYDWKWFGKADGLPGGDVFTLATRGNGLLIAGTDDGIFEQDGATWRKVFPVQGRSRFRIKQVMESADQSLWACCLFGLVNVSATETTLYTSREFERVASEVGVFDRIVVLQDSLLPTEVTYPGTGMFVVGNSIVVLGEDSPAREAGMQTGDRILSVDDHVLNVGEDLRRAPGHQVKVRVERASSGKELEISFVTSTVKARYRSPAMHSVMQDRSGRIWAGATKGRMLMSPDNGATWQSWSRKQGLVTGSLPTALEAMDGKIWVFSAGRKDNVSRFDGERWSNKDLAVLGGRGSISACAQTSDGTIWVSGLSKIHQYRQGKWIKHDTRDVKLPSEGHRMLVASDGALWIAGYDQMAVRIADQTQELVSLDQLEHKCTDEKGTNWFVATDSNRVVRQTGNEAVSFGIEDGLIDNPDGIIATPDGTVVVFGSHQEIASLATFDGTTWQRRSFPDVARQFSNRGFCVTRDGRIWIGSKGDRGSDQAGGVIVGRGDQWQHLAPPQAPAHCTSIMEMHDGRMVFGGSFGVKLFDGQDWHSVDDELLENTSCPAGAIGPDGTVWMSTRTKGLLRFQNETWSSINANNGMPSNEISALHVDRDGIVWCSTRNGLCRYDGSMVAAIGFPEKLGRSSIRAGGDRTLWLDDVVRYLPGTRAPQVNLSLDPITVDLNNDASVQWHGVDAWNRTSSDDLKWSWRLDSGPWSKFSKNDQVALKDLTSGEHRFELRGLDSDGNLSTADSPLAINVLPPYWMQPWFLLSAICLVALILWQTISLIKRGVALQRSNEELKVARERLATRYAEKSAQFRAICDCSPIGIFVTCPDNNITYFNSYLAEAAGVPANLMNNNSIWRDTLHPEDRERIMTTWFDAAEKGKQIQFSGRFLRPDKTVRWFDVAADRIVLDGELLGYVGALEDVTDKVQSKEALEATNHQLQEALERLQQAQEQAIKRERLNALGKMAAGVVHDINNAMTPLMTYTEMLENHAGLTGECQEWLNLICMGVKDTSGTVKRLEHFYRETHNRTFLGEVDLAKISSQVVEFTRPKWQTEARTAGKQIVVDVQAQVHPIVKGDASQIRAVLTNLIFNSVEAIREQGSIEIRVGIEEQQAVVEVRDTGCGMTAEQLNHCLEPFYTSKESGCGLGLSECYGIVRQHGGTCEVESEVGAGTTMRFSIPCERVLNACAIEEPDLPSAIPNHVTLKGPHLAANGSGTEKRVLCVDDDQGILISTVALLTSLGVQVETASDGPSAIEFLKKHHVDLVFCDQGLPGMDGLAVLEAIKARWDIPVIMVSGWTLPEMGEGVQPDGFIEKPYSVAALQQVLDQHTDSSKVA